MANDGELSRRGNVSGLSEEALASSRGVLTGNHGHGARGLQSFHTDPTTAAFIAKVIGREAYVADLCAGSGALMSGFVGKRDGVEIDASIAKHSGAANVVVADIQHLFPLLRSLNARWPVLVNNPPFGIPFEVDGLGRGPSGTLTFAMALELTRARGMGAYIVGTNQLDTLILPEHKQHFTCILDVDDLFADLGVSLPCSIAFYAKDADEDTDPIRIHVQSRDDLAQHVGQVQQTLYGRVSLYSLKDEHLKDGEAGVRQRLAAAHAEYTRRLSGRLRAQKHTVELKGRRLSIRASAWTMIKCAETHKTGVLEWLATSNKQPPERFALQTGEWRRLQQLCADADLGISVSPAALAAIESAILASARDKCPLYPVEPVQRLGFLDDVDSLRCTVSDAARGFVAGESYPLTCQTDVLEQSGTREVLTEEGPTVRNTMQVRRALSIRLETPKGTERFKEEKSEIEYLLAHFDIPDPGDVASRFPAETQYWRGILARVEKEIQEREPGFRFGWYQSEDLARLLVKHRGMLCWEMGLGKALGLLAAARALELAGRLPDGCALFVMPQDLIPQFTAEALRFFGKPLTVVDRGADAGTRKKGDLSASAVTVVARVKERRQYLARVRAKQVSDAAFYRHVTATRSEEGAPSRGVDPGPDMPGFWSVTHYEALAVTGKSTDRQAELSMWSPGYGNLDLIKQRDGISLAPTHGRIDRRIFERTKETFEYDYRTRGEKRIRHARDAFDVKRMELSECPSCGATPVGRNDTEERPPVWPVESVSHNGKTITFDPSKRDGKTVPARGWVGRSHCRKCGYAHTALNAKAGYSILKNVFRAVFVDEATKVQGDGSLQSKSIRAIRARYRIGATGTPIRQYIPSAFWPLWWTIGTGARFPYDYRGGRDAWVHDFAVLEQDIYEDRTRGHERLLPEVTNLARLWALVSRCIVRRRMDEVGIVIGRTGDWTCPDCAKAHHINVGEGAAWSKPPYVQCCGRSWNTVAPITYHPIVVPWGVHQKKQAARWLCDASFLQWFKEKHPDTQLSDKAIGIMSACLGQLQRVEWAAVSPADDADRDYWLIPVSAFTPARLKVLELAQAAVRAGKKVLIGTERVAPGKWIAERLCELGIRAVHITEEDCHGKTRTKSPTKRTDAINAFRRGKADVICVGENAAALGHNLDRANVVIAEGLPWVMAVWCQFLMRARRLTSRQPVDVYLSITEGSITARKWALIQKQAAASDLALDGKIAGMEMEHVDSAQVLRELIEKGLPTDGTELLESGCEARFNSMREGVVPLVDLSTTADATPVPKVRAARKPVVRGARADAERERDAKRRKRTNGPSIAEIAKAIREHLATATCSPPPVDVSRSRGPLPKQTACPPADS